MVMLKSKPTYLGEQILITGNAKNSWDMNELNHEKPIKTP